MIYCDHAQEVTKGKHGILWYRIYSDMKGFCDRHAVFFESVPRVIL